MQEIFQKIKRVEPIIKMRQQKVDDETARLAALRKEKQSVVAMMKDSQRRYMQGYQELNQARCSIERINLATLESALDSIKFQWQRLRLEVEKIEMRETAQISHVLTAERDLRAIEKLKDRYNDEIRSTMRRQEQKMLDEHALYRHIEGKQ